jgi:hypothetical protein
MTFVRRRKGQALIDFIDLDGFLNEDRRGTKGKHKTKEKKKQRTLSRGTDSPVSMASLTTQEPFKRRRSQGTI